MSYKKKMLAALLAAMGCAAWADEPQDAGSVVISASLREHSVASAPAFTTIVTAADIAKAPVNSLGDLLRETVGVNNLTDGTGRDEIQIRGLAGKYTLMLLNGRRMSSGGALWRGSDFDFNAIPLNSIKRVEIVRGPMAALYGSDAIGGVINIITKTPTPDWQGAVSAEWRTIGRGEEGDQHRLGLSAAGALSEVLSLSLAGEAYGRQPWFSTSAADTTRPPRLEQKQTRNLVGTLGWRLTETQTLDLDYGYNKDQRPLGMYYYAYYPAWNYEARDFRAQTITRNTVGLTHKALWQWGSTTAYLSHEAARIDDFNSRYDKPQQRLLKEDNTYAKWYANADVGQHALTGGVDLRHQTIKDPLTYRQSGQMKTASAALFLEDEIKLNPAWSLTLAGREDHTDTFGNHFSPKTYLVYQASSELTIKGGVNRAFKAPEAYQLSPEYRIVSCGGSCYLGGNPQLKPEQSTNYELGAEYHRKGLNASAVLFQNDVKELIVALYDPAGPSRRWSNVAQAKTRGLELQADAALTPALSVSANYTRLNADYTDERGQQTALDNRPRHTANASLNWSATAWLQTALSAHYTGEQAQEGITLPGYTRVDLAATAKASRNLTLRAGVKNLADVNLESKDKHFETFELGRNYYLSATYTF